MHFASSSPCRFLCASALACSSHCSCSCSSLVICSFLAPLLVFRRGLRSIRTQPTFHSRPSAPRESCSCGRFKTPFSVAGAYNPPPMRGSRPIQSVIGTFPFFAMKLSALIDASERSGKRSARCSLVILLRWRSLMVGSLSPNRVLHPERPCAICVVAEVRWASRSAMS